MGFQFPVFRKDLHVRPAADPWTRDDFIHSVSIHIPRGHEHAAAEPLVVGKESRVQKFPVRAEDSHMRASARACPSNNFIRPVAIKVPKRHADAAEKFRVIGKKFADEP